jgi:carnosine N-methyltransferase
MEPVPFEEERKHFYSIIHSFEKYSDCMQGELGRRRRHFESLPQRIKEQLPPTMERALYDWVDMAVVINQQFLDMVVQEQFEPGGFASQFEESIADQEAANGTGADGATAAAAADARSEIDRRHPHRLPRSALPSASQFSKAKSTLHQLVRDWSSEGRPERDRSYGVLLRLLADALPVTKANKNRQRVLVPGCGLGRLVYELVAAGYATQGNEFSLQMLFTSHFMLNCIEQPHEFVVVPFCGDPSNHLSRAEQLRQVPIPDVCAAALLDSNPGADMSMVAGEFLALYDTPAHHGRWDAVVTCFFIDTAPVVVEYIEAIRRMLRPNGVWVNLGPLLFHWQDPGRDGGEGEATDERFQRSVELTYEEVRHVMAMNGFEVVAEGSEPAATYAANTRSMMRTVYSPVYFTAIARP